MRILYWSFSLIVLLIAIALFMHSWLLFGVYIGAFPTTLLVIWYLQKTSHAKQKTDPSEQALEGVAQDPPAPQTVRHILSINIAIVIGISLFWTLIVVMRGFFLTHVPYVGIIVLLLVIVSWETLWLSLGKISRVLVFRRSETAFPKWSLLGGVVSTSIRILLVLAPLILLYLVPMRFQRRMWLNSPPPLSPPNAFKIDQSIKLTIASAGTLLVDEQYEVEPQSHYALTGIREIDSGKISAVDIKKLERFEFGKFENIPLEGMHLNLHRALTADTEDLGLLRSKMTFSWPEITLLTRDLSDREGSSEDFPVSQASEFHSKIEIQLPKNSFLAASPKADLNSLPDKDVVTISLSKFPGRAEIYYLRHARLKIVKSFLSESSTHDVLVSVLAFMFWPVTMIMVGIFHKKLADSILGFLSRRFGRKSKKTIGFHP